MLHVKTTIESDWRVVPLPFAHSDSSQVSTSFAVSLPASGQVNCCLSSDKSRISWIQKDYFIQPRTEILLDYPCAVLMLRLFCSGRFCGFLLTFSATKGTTAWLGKVQENNKTVIRREHNPSHKQIPRIQNSVFICLPRDYRLAITIRWTITSIHLIDCVILGSVFLMRNPEREIVQERFGEGLLK